ncbi:AidA/PixA family protein [Flavobacterium sp.]|uniref:AidA/PixA family protein n=1 Tax=Flavobacterium sp. TaxID=239 RepID=UPI003D123EB5
MNQKVKASSETIDVLIVINAEYIKKNYPRNTDPNNAQKIDHNNHYLISHNPREIVLGQGTADLGIKAKLGDIFYLRTTTIHQNNDDFAVIVYKIEHGNGNTIFTPFQWDFSYTNAVQFNIDTYRPLPPLFKRQYFANYNAKIKSEGTENVFIYLALYVLSNNGESHELYGYYYWDPQFKVDFIK